MVSAPLHLYQVTTPHLCAGILVSPGGLVCRVAPILYWAVGKHVDVVRRYALRHGGKVVPVGVPAE